MSTPQIYKFAIFQGYLKYLHYFKKEVSCKVNCAHANKHQSFLEVNNFIFSWGNQCEKLVYYILEMTCQIIFIFCMEIDFLAMTKVSKRRNLLYIKNKMLGCHDFLNPDRPREFSLFHLINYIVYCILLNLLCLINKL